MCFDLASFSIWSQFQTEKKSGLTEKWGLSVEFVSLKHSPLTLEQRQHKEPLMMSLRLRSTQRHGIIITIRSWCAQESGSQPAQSVQFGLSSQAAAAALRRGKLDGFYWTLSKQTNQMSPGSWPWVTNPKWRSPSVLMKDTTKPLSQQYTSCPPPGMQEGGREWKGPWWWAPHDVELVRTDAEFTWQPLLLRNVPSVVEASS